MAWNDNASMYDEHLINYKHELDKHSTNLRKIFDEIKKDDSIDINTANMIEGAIVQIKSNRKRWASGTSGLNVDKEKFINNGNYEIPLISHNLNFTPSLLIVMLALPGDVKKTVMLWTNKITAFKMLATKSSFSFNFKDFYPGYAMNGRNEHLFSVFQEVNVIEWIAIE
ncbi:hypothetical protein [Peptostreptococcus sp. D1]|uniref:hypothetical protein n=1 Tax=Peptostreptococcus sp. D1 TaxID=72304 RepID=UPI0008E78205|nr:hypothetical protein [Peptostreptococcus sp. D1]SFE92335.1 hypothetical protein SAMN02910278_02079 [Peptostreptococcus sp. D1]